MLGKPPLVMILNGGKSGLWPHLHPGDGTGALEPVLTAAPDIVEEASTRVVARVRRAVQVASEEQDRHGHGMVPMAF